ncbi:MAG: hypothetical protein F4Z77_05945 [Dehalococcoidia bacterium]|nr:hypothetical protein [Dehalococcoidia bacterium]MYA53497.1 hypothetical protein [Dehalococcoidia bacterium]
MRVTAPPQVREPEDLSFLSTAHLAEGALEIDLTDVEWISPLGVVAVLATCLRADRTLGPIVNLPTNLEARTYLAQIRLLDEISRHGWILTSESPTRRRQRLWAETGDILSQLEQSGWMEIKDSLLGSSGTPSLDRRDWSEIDDIDIDPSITIGPHLPVSRLVTDSEVESAGNILTDALSRAGLSGGLGDDLWTIAAELSANGREHGDDCYVVAQTYTGRRSGTPGVHIAVADFGVGFAKRLRQHHGDMPDAEAILHGFRERVSGTGRSDKGNGLGYVSEAIDRHPDNTLHVVSNTGHVLRSGGQLQVVQGVQFQGTLASAFLPLPPDSVSLHPREVRRP